jgi:putative ABC transport system substrate-binding protein
MIVTASALTLLHRNLIIALGARHKLPAVYFLRAFVTDGGLISYGIDSIDIHRRAASYFGSPAPIHSRIGTHRSIGLRENIL